MIDLHGFPVVGKLMDWYKRTYSIRPLIDHIAYELSSGALRETHPNYFENDARTFSLWYIDTNQVGTEIPVLRIDGVRIPLNKPEQKFLKSTFDKYVSETNEIMVNAALNKLRKQFGIEAK